MQDSKKYEEQLVQTTNQLKLVFKVLDEAEDRIGRQDAINRAEQLLQRLYKVHRQLKSSLRTEDNTEEQQNVAMINCVEHYHKVHVLAKEIEQRREQINIFNKHNINHINKNSNNNNNEIVNAETNSNHILQDQNSEKIPLLFEEHEKFCIQQPFNKNTSKFEDKEFAAQLATKVQYIHHNTMLSLNNTERVLNQTEEIGSQAIAILQAQGEQIALTNSTLQGMSSNLEQAKDEIKAFMRRVAHDKIIIFFAIAIIACLIIIVSLTIVHHYIH